MTMLARNIKALERAGRRQLAVRMDASHKPLVSDKADMAERNADSAADSGFAGDGYARDDVKNNSPNKLAKISPTRTR